MTAPADTLDEAACAELERAVLASDTCTEVCRQRRGCREVIRYWNSSGTGNASCGCCQEGPEACDPIPLPDGVVGSDLPLLLSTIATLRADVLRLTAERDEEQRAFQRCEASRQAIAQEAVKLAGGLREACLIARQRNAHWLSAALDGDAEGDRDEIRRCAERTDDQLARLRSLLPTPEPEVTP